MSPTPSFCHQVLLQAASLRRFHPGAIVRAFVGHSCPTAEMHRLVEETFDGHRMGFEWVVGKAFDRWAGNRAPFLETMNRRWTSPIGDVVIIADADVLFTRPLTDILDRDAVQGVQAHVPPMSNLEFRCLFQVCDTPVPPFQTPYTGAGFMAPSGSLGPSYPNSGMIVLPKAHFEAMIPHYQTAVNQMRSSVRDHYWFDQLAVSIAIAKARVPYQPLSMKYNFPNQREFEERYPEELGDIRALHYLREDRISRTADFESVAALRRLVQRDDLTGSHEILRRTIAANLHVLEPPHLGSPGTEPPWA